MRKDQATAELPLLGAVLRRPESVSEALITSFGEDEQAAVTAAVVWAWCNRRIQAMTGSRAAELCGIRRQHFSLIVGGRRLYLPPHKINAFQDVVGNTAVMQTIARFEALREAQKREHLGRLVAENILPLRAAGGGG